MTNREHVTMYVPSLMYVVYVVYVMNAYMYFCMDACMYACR